MVALQFRIEFQDARPGDHGRERPAGALHPEPRLLHGPPEAGHSLEAGGLPRSRPLARLERNGFLLQRPPRLVPPLAGRRSPAVEPRRAGPQPGLRQGRRLDEAVSIVSVALLPAAGASRRMGRPKLLLPVGGRPMVAGVVEALRGGGVGEIVLVTAPGDEPLQTWARQNGV